MLVRKKKKILRRRTFGRGVLAFSSLAMVVLAVFTNTLFNLPTPYATAVAYPGDIAIYREVAGGDPVNGTAAAPFDHDWDTVVVEDTTSFQLEPTASTSILLKKGHYAVMYGARFDSTGGTRRSEVQSQIRLAGADIPIGWSQGYTRRMASDNELLTSGGGIIHVANDNDALVLRSFRTDANLTATLARAANSTGIQLIKLKDDWDYLRLSKTTTQVGPNSSTWIPVIYDRQDEVDTGTFAHNSGSSAITLKKPGHYLVFANTYGALDAASTDRTVVQQRITVGGVQVEGTLTTVYIRGNTDGNSAQEGAASIGTIIETTAANQTLQVEVNRGDGTAAWTINTDENGNYVDRTAVTIVKLPDTADYIRLEDSGTDDMNPSAITQMGWDTEREIDTTSFTHSTTVNDSRIQVNTADAYLFLNALYAYPATVARAKTNQGWRVNGGTLDGYGQTGAYNRNNRGADELGNWSGIIYPNLSAGDYVEVVSRQLGATGFIGTTNKGVQGVRLGTLFDPSVTVTATGTQVSLISIPSAGKYIGGAFTITDNTGSHTVTSITITASGTVDAKNDLNNIKLFYDLDTTAPYDCASETYDGTEPQFGATDTDGFSAANNGTSTFSGSVNISTTTTMCVYTVLDVGSGASFGQTLDISIADPLNDILLAEGVASPKTEVAIAGVSTLAAPQLTQIHYHWRNDDGTEAGATSATGGVEDTPLADAREAQTYRVRFEVSNEGNESSSNERYRLEYAEKGASCAAATGWSRIDTAGSAWQMANSPNLTHGADTTNIAIAAGGVTDENTTFLTPNGGIYDLADQGGVTSLAATEFAELEFSISPTGSAIDGTTYCFRVTDAGTPLASYAAYPEATFQVHVQATTTGAQRAAVDIPSIGKHIGGAFVVRDLSGADTHTVTSITITASGTVDAKNDLNNIKLFYDLDTTAPYDCASETYDGTEPQFGATDTDGFSAANNGTSTFSGSVTASSTQAICFYPVLDVLPGAVDGETLDLEISSPDNDIVIADGGVVRPSSAVAIPGVTTLRDDVLTQIHYHWRNDDGTEAGATSATGGVEDTPILSLSKLTPKRIRFEVSNEGATSSAPISYRLEYGVKSGSCAAVGTWTDVGEAGGHWDMYDSVNLTDGADTTNIAVSAGGVTDENTTFLTPNGGVKDTSSQTASTTLTKNEFFEIEYSIQSTASAVDGNTYCFRLTDAGAPLADYTVYPEVTISPDIQVSATGTQAAFMDVPSTNQYIGGAFSVEDLSGSHTVTSITITASGTVDAKNDLNNIKLFYDLDTTAPYDCASETYDGTEPQFGATDTDGFSAANNGTSTFSGSVNISTTTTMCVYTVLDVGSGASDGELLDVFIENPAVDVAATGAVVPFTQEHISGMTTLRKSVLTQIHYHWRNDDGTEAGATSATGGVEDTAYTDFKRGVRSRLRFEVSNEGATSSDPTSYRLEYAVRGASCSAASTWTDVGSSGGAFDMSNSPNLSDGADTTNIAVSAGGVTDENTTFLTPNGGVKDTSSQTAAIALSATEFLELEYSIIASTSAAYGENYCFRLTDAGAPLADYAVYPELTIGADVAVSATGTQTAAIDVPGADKYVGGSFVIRDISSSRQITSITITASGTVDAKNDLNNIKLFYDLDTTAPYDCASETYDGTEPQFGATDTDGFSAANNGTSTFSGSVNISTTTTMCVYTVLDVGSGASDGELLDVLIADPTQDVGVSVGNVGTASPVPISGMTTLRDDVLTQIHYHWRNDDGTEAGATSATGGVEDTVLTNVPKNTVYRLRMEVSNEGATTSAETRYRLEYGKLLTSCSAIGTWTDVGAAGGDWDITDSLNLTDGADTTNIAVSAGGVTDENTTFLTPNGGVKDTSSLTASTTLTASRFVEFEFAVSATDQSVYEATYCFRLADEKGNPIASYAVYPQATIRKNRDFRVERGSVQITGTSTTLIAGVDYTAPAASTSAFVRITNTQITGAGRDVGGGSQNADDVTAYILPGNIENRVVIARPPTAINSTRVSWEIVTYIGPPGGDNEIVVRRATTTTYLSTEVTATSSAIAGVVNDADMVIFITGQGNPDTGRNNYHRGLSTAAWDATANKAVFTRGASGNAAIVSWAAVEFTGKNWKIQRVEHTYAASGAFETESITPVNTLTRAFLHTQKRTGVNGLDETGHEVYLSGVGTVSFQIQSGATTPSAHTSVAWVIENTQTTGVPMVVTRSSGVRPNTGAEPETANIDIGTTLSDMSVASIFTNNRSSGAGTAFPRPMMGVEIVSPTQYQLWRSDTGQYQTYRTEVVEWPTAVRTVSQNYYRFYVNNDALDPTDPWPAGAADLGENTPIGSSDSPPVFGDVVRIRMSLAVSGATLPAGAGSYKLQFGLRETSCAAITSWQDIGTSTESTQWRGYNAAPADGTALSSNPPTAGDLNLSVSDRAGTYEEANDTAVNPYAVAAGEDIEYDWVVQHNGAAESGDYCFRMVTSAGDPLDAYNFYPVITAAGFKPVTKNWRWADDEQNETPTTPLAPENTAPTNIDFENAIKLRVTVAETAGKTQPGAKFRLQYSESSSFPAGETFDVTEIPACTATSTWCYFDGGGADNATITTAILSDADTCVGGVGAGCGTHNESGTTTSVFTQPALSNTEYEFTIVHSGALPNTTYFFRLYDVQNATSVSPASGSSYPSLSTRGSTLTVVVEGLPAGTSTEGVILDATSTATEVAFGTLPIASEVEAGQRITVTTNAYAGYQITVYQEQGLVGPYGEISPVTGTNPSPVSWTTGCAATATGCYGYHAGDDTLAGGSVRFAPDDTYARFQSTPEEIAYSAVPVNNEVTDVIFKTKVTGTQEAGDYQGNIVYIVTPVF